MLRPDQENWPNVFPYMALYWAYSRANAGPIFLVCRGRKYGDYSLRRRLR